MSRRKKTATRVAACVAAAALAALVALAVVLLPNYAANTEGSAAKTTSDAVNEQEAKEAANGTTTAPADATTSTAATRQIDWDSLPESVIAWVEVPGTEIDYAIAMGPEADPDYYLTHDAWGNYDIYGVPYVTPLCTEGLASRNVIIYGHNMSDGSMFAGFTNFKWPSVAAKHSVINLYVRASNSLHMLHVIGVNVVDANVEKAQSEFADSTALTEYVHTKLAESEIVMRQPTCVDQLFTFVTCSYDYQNGRTLVYAIEEE
jgi:sortase B